MIWEAKNENKRVASPESVPINLSLAHTYTDNGTAKSVIIFVDKSTVSELLNQSLSKSPTTEFCRANAFVS